MPAYRRLVGESDGGELLGEKEYKCLQEKAKMAAKNRLFVTYHCEKLNLDCYTVGPDSRCFCGHSYKAHAWWETDSKRPHCRCKGCRCDVFSYVMGHGKWFIKCRCKHDHHDHMHDGKAGGCKQTACKCATFYSPTR